MEQERFQYHGRFNVFFRASRFVVTRENQHKLRSLLFCDIGKVNWSIHDQLVEVYNRMFAQDRPCEMVVTVSDPLTRRQAESFNDRNESWALAAAAVGRLLFPTRMPAYRQAGGVAAGISVKTYLGTRHAGDVLIDIQAWVNGGIGQQHSSRSMLIEAQGGVTVQ